MDDKIKQIADALTELGFKAEVFNNNNIEGQYKEARFYVRELFKKDKLTVSPVQLRSKLDTNWWFNIDTPVINVSSSKDAVTIASEIKRRFLDKFVVDAERTLLKLKEVEASLSVERKNLTEIYEHLAWGEPDFKSNRHSGFFNDNFVEMTSGETVNLKINSLTVDQVKRIFEVLTP